MTENSPEPTISDEDVAGHARSVVEEPDADDVAGHARTSALDEPDTDDVAGHAKM